MPERAVRLFLIDPHPLSLNFSSIEDKDGHHFGFSVTIDRKKEYKTGQTSIKYPTYRSGPLLLHAVT
ncbi:hypothetical protein [Pajaroellobacter abortibovis]|uniref:hypothetical protein n=1 Tax=Pajaroellobacter abortibovis TaxID=1882918 RepID=UPI00094AFFEF|nr:hypothetical protein [Pajaroellobacter abortibovis]